MALKYMKDHDVRADPRFCHIAVKLFVKINGKLENTMYIHVRIFRQFLCNQKNLFHCSLLS